MTTKPNVNKHMSSQLADEIRPDRSCNKIHSGSSLSDKIDSTEKMLTLKFASQRLMYFYIYVHLDKPKIATLARLKPSPDVIKRDKSRRLNVEKNITMLKIARFRSRARQPKSFTCIKFHSATTRREKKKLRRLLEEKLDAFLSIGNHAKPPKKRTRPPLRCFAYGKESECVCNLIV